MAHVFVSYNQADADFASVLCNELERAGIDTWMDRNRLRPGQNWSEEIDEGIRTAFALVVVMSPEAKASEYVTFEWSFAIGAGLPVIPAMVRKTELHPRLGRVQYLDFTNIKVRPWGDLIDFLKEKATSIRVPSNLPNYLKNAVNDLDNTAPEIVVRALKLLYTSQDPRAVDIVYMALDHANIITRSQAAAIVLDDAPQVAKRVFNDSASFDWAFVLNGREDAPELMSIILEVARANKWERDGEEYKKIMKYVRFPFSLRRAIDPHDATTAFRNEFGPIQEQEVITVPIHD